MNTLTAHPYRVRDDALPAVARHGLVGVVVLAHLGGAWGLMQIESVRNAVAEVAPLIVDFVAPPTPKEPPKPAPPPPMPRNLPPPPPPVIATTAPIMDASPTAMVVPPPPPEPITAPPEPAAPPAPPAPAPVVRNIPATAVSYIEQPAPVYPLASKRLQEQGEVLVRVEIGTDGRARQVLVGRSSGHPRLDAAAVAAVRAARFRPYTENGVPLVVWSTVPIQFELEK